MATDASCHDGVNNKTKKRAAGREGGYKRGAGQNNQSSTVGFPKNATARRATVSIGTRQRQTRRPVSSHSSIREGGLGSKAKKVFKQKCGKMMAFLGACTHAALCTVLAVDVQFIRFADESELWACSTCVVNVFNAADFFFQIFSGQRPKQN